MIDIEDLLSNFDHPKTELQDSPKQGVIQGLSVDKLIDALLRHTNHNGVVLECLQTAMGLSRVPLHAHALLRLPEDPSSGRDFLRLLPHLMALHLHDPRMALVGLCLLGTLLRQGMALVALQWEQGEQGGVALVREAPAETLGRVNEALGAVQRALAAHPKDTGVASYAFYAAQGCLTVLQELAPRLAGAEEALGVALVAHPGRRSEGGEEDACGERSPASGESARGSCCASSECCREKVVPASVPLQSCTSSLILSFFIPLSSEFLDDHEKLKDAFFSQNILQYINQILDLCISQHLSLPSDMTESFIKKFNQDSFLDILFTHPEDIICLSDSIIRKLAEL